MFATQTHLGVISDTLLGRAMDLKAWKWLETSKQVNVNVTLPEISIATENMPSQQESSIPTIHF